jgi:hypothetical protein
MKTEKKKIDRRTFLKTTGIGSASLALSAGVTGKVMAAGVANNSSSKKCPHAFLERQVSPFRSRMYFDT